MRSPPLPAALSVELARLEAQLGQAADPWAVGQLAALGEAAAWKVLLELADAGTRVRNLSALLIWLAKREAMSRNATRVPTAESAACGSAPFRASHQEDSISGPFYHDPVQMEVQRLNTEMAVDLSNQARIEEPVSTAHQMPQNPPCFFSRGLHNQSLSSAVASPMAYHGRSGGSYTGTMPGTPPRDLIPSPVRDVTQLVQQMGDPSGRAGVATPPSFDNVNSLRARASPQMLALGELEFDRFFLIQVYLADKKIEDVIDDPNYIRYLKSLSMDCFESEIWNKFGEKFVPVSDRRKNLDWDPGKTRMYHCNIKKRDDSIVTTFKGPYLENTRTHLQKVLGDDNVLIVRFDDIDIPRGMNGDAYFGIYYTYYRHVAEDGILLGLRRYCFFIYKDGGKTRKQKEFDKKEKNKKCCSSVRCYFIRTESGWDMDAPYKLSGYTIDQARRLFMHIHTAPTVAKYISRFSLILSKTIKLDLDFMKIQVVTIDDEPCKDEFGNVAFDEHGKRLIHTDGTGLISVDLAMKCPTSIFKGNFLKDAVDSKELQHSTTEHPLLMQIRMFNNGRTVKGTLLVDKRLPPETICIRPSMIKINTDPKLLGCNSFNSLEINATSNRPKRAPTSRFLIALLHHGKVKADYFMYLLRKALEDVKKARHTTRDSLEVAFNHADMDDSMSARMILSGIQRENEAYLEYQLALMTKQERKGLQQGRIPIDECYYLMGTTDPTGTLKPDQVCIILDHGQVSGKVLVYKHPGLHFGDIHVLTATYIDGLEKVVGNSKYAIFFPTSGPRSLADEIANSDFDGDMYWVSRNPQLLEQYKKSDPWVRRSEPKNGVQNRPEEYDVSELEGVLFSEFLRARFTPSYVLGTAADCWLVLMDRLLTENVPESERNAVTEDMLDLVDIYYLALDAPKEGNKVVVPAKLKANRYPHFMERENYPSYHSASVLGKIYDEVKRQESETVSLIKISPLKCFTEEVVAEEYKTRWRYFYQQGYLKESAQLCQVYDKEIKNIKFRALYQKYKQILYDAEEFELSQRSRPELFQEACAIYQVVYQLVMGRDEVSKCGFVWKVAGRALCQFYALKHGEDTALCSFPVLEDAFKRYRP